jgi:hypothetical protein
MCGTIKRALINKTRKDTQLKFYKVMAAPVLLYGCENWALNRVDRRKTQTAEMKFLRRVAGYTLRDEVTNIPYEKNYRYLTLVKELNHVK